MFWAHWGKCIFPLALACLSPYRSLLVTERSGLSLDCPPQPKLRTGAASGRMDGKIFYVYTASMKAKGELDLNQHYSSSSAKQPSVDTPGSLWILVHTFPSPCDVFLEKQEHRTWLFDYSTATPENIKEHVPALERFNGHIQENSESTKMWCRTKESVPCCIAFNYTSGLRPSQKIHKVKKGKQLKGNSEMKCNIFGQGLLVSLSESKPIKLAHY